MSKSLNLKLRDFTTVSEDGEKGVFTAYANVKWTIDSYDEVTVDGAFKQSIERHRANGTVPKMLFQHNPDIVIGKWISIEEDELGLKVTGQLALTTQKGAEIYELLKMGALDSLSIGYLTIKERYDPSNGITYLEVVDVYEISVVTFPANDKSTVTEIKSAVPEVVVDEPAVEIAPINNVTEEETKAAEELETKRRTLDLVVKLTSMFVRK